MSNLPSQRGVRTGRPPRKDKVSIDGTKTPPMTPRMIAALANFKHLPDEGVIRIGVVAILLSCSTATVWRMIRNHRLEKITISEGVASIRVGSVRNVLKGGVP